MVRRDLHVSRTDTSNRVVGELTNGGDRSKILESKIGFSITSSSSGHRTRSRIWHWISTGSLVRYEVAMTNEVLGFQLGWASARTIGCMW